MRRVTLPMLTPALAGAGLLVFMTSMGSFSAPYIFGGGFRVLTMQVYASKLNGDLQMSAVETVILAAVSVLFLVMLQRYESSRSAGRTSSSSATKTPARTSRVSIPSSPAARPTPSIPSNTCAT